MKTIELEIIARISKYAPAAPQKNYLKNKDYVISVFVESACVKIGEDWSGMCACKQNALNKFTHKQFLKFIRAQNANACADKSETVVAL